MYPLSWGPRWGYMQVMNGPRQWISLGKLLRSMTFGVKDGITSCLSVYPPVVTRPFDPDETNIGYLDQVHPVL
jgi:hypothetical protein